MGRKKIDIKDKKKVISLRIPLDIYDDFEQLKFKNKSRFFSELIEEHFNELEEK